MRLFMKRTARENTTDYTLFDYSMSGPLETPSLTAKLPQQWLENERRILDRQGVLVILHPQPACVGHCIVVTKQVTTSLENFDRDTISAIGMILPEIKRALRLATCYSNFGVFLRSGHDYGQENNQIYFEIIPTSELNPNFHIDWKSDKNLYTMKEKMLCPTKAKNLISMLRKCMMLHSHESRGNLLYETDRICCEMFSNPSNTGHMCVSPKRLSPDLEDCEAIDIAECLWIMPQLAKACIKSINAKAFLLILLDGPGCGQSSPHLVWHFIPSNSKNNLVTFNVKQDHSVKFNMKLIEAMREILAEGVSTRATGFYPTPQESAWSSIVVGKSVNHGSYGTNANSHRPVSLVTR